MRKEKQLLLDEIKEKIGGSKALVLTRYKNLSPNLSSDFRKQLAETGGGFAVVKKRLLLKAAEQGGMDLDPESLTGHIGVVLSYGDPLATTKSFYQFAKKNADIFEVIGGQFEGRMVNAAEVKELSELPSLNEMRAQFLGLLEAPMSQTLAVMEALLTSVMHCLDNKSQQGTE